MKRIKHFFEGDLIVICAVVITAVIVAYLVCSPKEVAWSPCGVRIEGTAISEVVYVASVHSEVLHSPDCKWAKKIYGRNFIGFKSREDAVNSGRRPCKVCKP